MDAETARAFLLKLPHVVETQQWGDNLVFWVGDKAIGGKMFCLIDLSAGRHVVSYSAGPEHFSELIECEGLVPAPYFARIHWIAAERWSALRNAEWQSELSAAHAITFAKLPRHTLHALTLPATAREKLIREGRKKKALKKAAKQK